MEHEKQFIEYLQSKDHSDTTQQAYLRHVSLFSDWLDKQPESCTKKDVLKYLEYLKDHRRQNNITRLNALIAIKHYFTPLLKSGQVTGNPAALIRIRGTGKRQLHRTYTPEELNQLFDNYYQLFVKDYDDSHIPRNQRTQSRLSKERNAVILSIMINQGTTTKEIDKMHLQDMDLNKATLKIRSGKKSNERILPLKAEQIGLFMNYLQTLRPQLLEYHTTDSKKLFLALPEYSKRTTDSATLMHVFKPLTAHLKSIDKRFLNFKQIRASVITNWLKIYGLRKVQYLAGHRYISSTERYLPGETESLADDITRYNPF